MEAAGTAASLESVGSGGLTDLKGIVPNVGIARSRVKGLQNSHSNKRLPTWKATGQSSLLPSDKLNGGVSSPVAYERAQIGERSLDRVAATGNTGKASTNLLSG